VSLQAWFHTARQPQIYRRAVKVALIVGTLLVLINYLEKIIAGSLTHGDFIRIGLTYLVPYCVSTYAAVSAIRQQQ